MMAYLDRFNLDQLEERAASLEDRMATHEARAAYDARMLAEVRAAIERKTPAASDS